MRLTKIGLAGTGREVTAPCSLKGDTVHVHVNYMPGRKVGLMYSDSVIGAPYVTWDSVMDAFGVSVDDPQVVVE